MTSLFNMARQAYLTTSGSQFAEERAQRAVAALSRRSLAFYFISASDRIAVGYV
jgi:hypothetical protein